MKRLLTILLGVSLIATLTGCDNKETPKTEVETTVITTETTEEITTEEVVTEEVVTEEVVTEEVVTTKLTSEDYTLVYLGEKKYEDSDSFGDYFPYLDEDTGTIYTHTFIGEVYNYEDIDISFTELMNVYNIEDNTVYYKDSKNYVTASNEFYFEKTLGDDKGYGWVVIFCTTEDLDETKLGIKGDLYEEYTLQVNGELEDLQCLGSEAWYYHSLLNIDNDLYLCRHSGGSGVGSINGINTDYVEYEILFNLSNVILPKKDTVNWGINQFDDIQMVVKQTNEPVTCLEGIEEYYNIDGRDIEFGFKSKLEDFEELNGYISPNEYVLKLTIDGKDMILNRTLYRE